MRTGYIVRVNAVEGVVEVLHRASLDRRLTVGCVPAGPYSWSLLTPTPPEPVDYPSSYPAYRRAYRREGAVRVVA